MRKIRLHSRAKENLQDRFARELNPEQYAAATAPDGYNLILAGPGSGKTRVITYRVAYLIARGVPAETILLVTFTRRAAREMLSRLETLVGAEAAKVWAGTFHHIGNRIVRKSADLLGFGANFSILDGEDQQQFIRLAMDDAELFGTGKLAPKPSTVLGLISYAFNVEQPLADVLADRAPGLVPLQDQILAAAKLYAERKLKANSLDYDDLLAQWARLLEEFPERSLAISKSFRQVLIDETQDTNKTQVKIVERIAREGWGNLTAVGDDAQSIYGFRGANYDNILKFPDRHPGCRVFHLDLNYRSTPEIVAFTNASIACNQSGFPKALRSARESAQKPCMVTAADASEEAEYIGQQIVEWHEQGVELRKLAVLYRNHHDSVLLQAELLARGIPYTVRSGLRFFEQAHVKDVLAYLRLMSNPRDETAWRRLLLLLPGIGPAKTAALYSHLAEQPDPIAALATKETMGMIPTKGKGMFAGFVNDLRMVQASAPGTNPAIAIEAILKGGYPAMVRSRYERPDNRLADIEQLVILAGRYDSLERLLADLMLAGDLYGTDTLASAEEADHVVLSSIHQSKGLEWSKVFVIRLVEDGFPNARGLDEEGGEEEERRIFYVAVTRCMDELILTYPNLITRGRGPTQVARPSRFLQELDPSLMDQAAIEGSNDLAWTDRAPLG